MFPSLSFNDEVGSPLVRYASRPATRCSKVGVGATDVAVAVWAWAEPAMVVKNKHTAAAMQVSLVNDFVILFLVVWLLC
jgi:hypothetical protein